MMVDDLLEKYGHTMKTEHVAEIINKTPRQVREMCRNNQLPAFKIVKNGNWRIRTIQFALMLGEE